MVLIERIKCRIRKILQRHSILPLEFVCEHTIELLNADSSIEKSTLTIYGYGPSQVQITDGCFSGNKYTGHDIWDAFLTFRKDAEDAGKLLLCNGARKNAIQSGMSRDMGNGMTVYLVEKGKSATIENLVGVFDPALQEHVVTLAEQEAANADWYRSVR